MNEEMRLEKISVREPEAGGRDIEAITEEILAAKQAGGEAILTIGRGLIEAKALLPHGEWLPWLTERVEFSERSAQNIMRLAREWTNPQALADLGATKALVLLALPAEEREDFLSAAHTVGGEEKTAAEMSTRELAQAIRERDEARVEAERSAAEQREALAARDEMARQMKVANDSLSEANRELERVRRELEALRSRPVEVAVEQVVDEEAVKKAREEALAEMRAKVDRAKAAKAKAEERQKAAEEALAAANARLEERAKAEKQTALRSDKDVAQFEVLFDQGQTLAGKLRDLLARARSREDQTAAQGMEKALLALAEAIRRCVE